MFASRCCYAINLLVSGIKEFPQDLFSVEQLRHGAIIIHIFVVRKFFILEMGSVLLLCLILMNKI